GVGICLENADARFTALGHWRWQANTDELRVILGFRRDQAAGLGFFATDCFEREVLPGAALDHALFGRRGAWTNRVEEKLGSGACRGDIIGNGKLVRFRRLELIERELVGRAGGRTQRQRKPDCSNSSCSLHASSSPPLARPAGPDCEIADRRASRPTSVQR